MDVTGHRSTDGVRAYKRICEEQYKDVSNVLQVSEHKRVKTSELSEKENTPPGRATPADTPATTLGLCESECIASESELSKCTCKPSGLPLAIPSLNISACSSVTINYRV